jgi:hypothetical protein
MTVDSTTTIAHRNDVEVRVVRHAVPAPERSIEVFEGERLVAFTHQLARLDARAALPSRDAALTAALATLQRVAPDLVGNVEVQWIEPHDEGVIRGMKVKTRQADGRYAWVVVGAKGETITFERDVVWSEGMSRRMTEQLLQ